jgi:GNAT superfamily N-acetyltransferase
MVSSDRPFRITRTDLADPVHRDALLGLLDEYAAGPTGRGYPLEPAARAALPGVLAARAHFCGWLAFADDQPAGLINCFEGVSTFRAQPLLNVHDIAVSAPFRRRGIARALLAQAEAEARRRGCCKLTLEVLDRNHGALAAYLQSGFRAYALDPAMGTAVFLEKSLD